MIRRHATWAVLAAAATAALLAAHEPPAATGTDTSKAGENSAVSLFEGTGRNPGSAAYHRAPGRVRQDAPAQHELGTRLFESPESVEKYRMKDVLEPMEPEPFPDLDPRFEHAVRMSDDTRSDDFPSIAVNPLQPGQVWMVWASYSGRRDQLRLAHRDPEVGAWGAWNAVPGVTGDVWRPSLSFDAQGRLWVIWSQQEPFVANFDLYARSFDGDRWGPLIRITSAPEGDFDQAVARGPDGRLHVAWQGFRDGQSDIFYVTFDGSEWSDAVRVSESDRNDWAPAIAVDSYGTAHIVWDTYDRGSYDVVMRTVTGTALGPVREVAASELFEARPSVAMDPAGRIWVAHEVGEPGWGKDQGRLIPRDPQPGAMLCQERQVQVRVFDGGSVAAAKPEVASFFDAGDPQIGLSHAPILAVPQLAVDGNGRVNLIVRALHTRGEWAEVCRVYLLTMTADGWTPPALVPYSEGVRLSMYAAATPDAEGGLWVAWPRDNVPSFSTFLRFPEETLIENVYCARYRPVEARTGLALGEPERPPFRVRPAGHADEDGDVARIRSHRVSVQESDGPPGSRRGRTTTYQILRGDAHRHTELSMDIRAFPDGSILDFYRYMLDAAAQDWGLITDHQYASHREYWWWLEEKLADMFHAPEGYIPLFGYERSVAWPNGHRNVIHSYRGVPAVPFFSKVTLPVRVDTSPPVIPDDTKLLYEELRRTGGIAVSHTSATDMGTDWRDNDSELEPVVELGQGDRRSYEHLGAPLSDPKEAAQGTSPYEAGFVSKAWEKGLRLGVILSSDHLSTHISYAMVWARDRSREAVLEALRTRRTYAATDNIILEFWVGDHFMGSELTADEVPPIRVRAVGTNTISDVQVLRNNRSVYAHRGGSREVDLSFVDTAPEPGTNFYYVRVRQVDEQTAWSSPIWVNLPARQ